MKALREWLSAFGMVLFTLLLIDLYVRTLAPVTVCRAVPHVLPMPRAAPMLPIVPRERFAI